MKSVKINRFLAKLTVVVLLASLIAGCTPDAYERSADLDVKKLLDDRQQQTLGYTGHIQPETEISTKTNSKSYDRLPVTRTPPTTQPMLQPTGYALGAVTLGPELLFPSGTNAPTHKSLTIDEARGPAIERMRLGPPAVYSNKVVFDVFQSIQYAVEHARDYKTQEEDLYLSALSVTLERHLALEPHPFVTSGVSYTRTNLFSPDNHNSEVAFTNAAGVTQPLPYGGSVTGKATYDFINAINGNLVDGENANVALTASIPLLRGAGLVNLEGLIQSEREMVYQVRAFEDFRRAFVVRIASAYIRLVAAQQAISDTRFNYVVAVQNKEQAEALYQSGRSGNFLNVQRTDTSLYQSEQSIIQREDAYDSSLDDFKITIGMPVDQPLEVVGIKFDVLPPNLDADAIELAARYRLDLQTAADRIEDARRGVSVAKNHLLPDVNFDARSGIGNLPNTAGSAFNDNTFNYQVGLTVDLPVDRLAERNAFRRSLIDLERAQRSWRDLHDQIVSQVRDAIRGIRSARVQVEIAQRRIDLAHQHLDYSNELLILGRATDSRDSVDAQNELLSAQDFYEQSQANYQIQVLSYLRDTGTLRVSPDAGQLGLIMNPPKNGSQKGETN